MTDTLDYEYDEIGYEGKLQKLFQRSRKNRKALKTADYENLDKLLEENLRIQRALENLNNELQVEHFLMAGPQGQDPD